MPSKLIKYPVDSDFSVIWYPSFEYVGPELQWYSTGHKDWNTVKSTKW